MPQDNPPLLDKTMNTTEQNPRNLADVLASGLANIANNVKPDGSDISINVPGMSANNVDDGFSELKQSLDVKATVIDVGAISGSDNKTIIINVFNAINIFDVPVLVKFDNSGKGIGLAYKYSGGEHGMMVCMRYGFPNVFTLRRMSNSDTVTYFTGTPY